MRRILGSPAARLAWAIALALVPASGQALAGDDGPGKPEATGSQGGAGGGYGPGGAGVDRSGLPDSFKYYGPNGLWYKWDEGQRLGRDTWIFSTYGNQKFYRILARFGGEQGISVDFYRLLDSRRRGDRFRELGLINEPNFEGGEHKDKYGFYMDKWLGDPVEGAYPEDDRWYGEPTGIIGLRIFPNPDFTEDMEREWLKDPEASVRRYFADPGHVEPPRIVGITCALCHIAFDPLNPPADVTRPRWENLAANIGNQYLREGDLFFGAGRVVGGNANPGPAFHDQGDPYDTRGLGEDSFLYQYGHTQQPGTSETSRFSYDFINNPNTINQIFYIGNRAAFGETTPTGVRVLTNHILKDGSDSIGLMGALLRVPINIGSEGDYWINHLWNPTTGQTQKPFSIKEIRMEVPEGRKAELRAKYPELGEAWKETERRVPFVASYLASYTPYDLARIRDTDGSPKHLSKDRAQLRRGGRLFADHCARCHSNKQPFYPLSTEEEKRTFYEDLVDRDDFLAGNTLSNDVRYPFNEPGLAINAARALATNAIDGDIWADFSSEEYKALPALRFMKFENPLNRLDADRYGGTPIVTEFTAPGGGRGYYRTAALNSLWTSAPFLHNNSVGRDPVGDDGTLDPRYVTVEGRLELFEEAMDQLLNPEKRPLKIKVTSADCSLLAGLPGIRDHLAQTLRAMARERTLEIFRAVADELVGGADVPEELKPVLKLVVADLLQRLQPEIDALYTKANLEKIKGAVIQQVEQQVDQVIAEKLEGKPQLRQLLAPLTPKLREAFDRHAGDLAELFRADLTIPEGTPINLILNLHVSKFPYALKVYLKHKHDPRALAEELLKLSDCPDLVENHGHTYGSDLSAEQKRDLIEYLKTL